jgi:hypothetical protein
MCRMEGGGGIRPREGQGRGRQGGGGVGRGLVVRGGKGVGLGSCLLPHLLIRTSLACSLSGLYGLVAAHPSPALPC